MHDEVQLVRTSGGEDEATAERQVPPPPAGTSTGANRLSGRTGSGNDQEDPISACGPADSYSLIANEIECEGGGNPLRGDPAGGAGARVGNVGANSTGHIIDLYEIPCPEGPLRIFVDMYGCEEMGTLLP